MSSNSSIPGRDAVSFGRVSIYFGLLDPEDGGTSAPPKHRELHARQHTPSHHRRFKSLNENNERGIPLNA